MPMPLFQTEKVVNPEVEAEVRDLFEYHKWTEEMQTAGEKVRESLIQAVLTIIKNVPPGPTRSRAINNIIDARMLANAAITFSGKY